MWRNPQETADLVTFTGKNLNGKVHFLCSGNEFNKGVRKRGYFIYEFFIEVITNNC